jgi:hypothetical protein
MKTGKRLNANMVPVEASALCAGASVLLYQRRRGGVIEAYRRVEVLMVVLDRALVRLVGLTDDQWVVVGDLYEEANNG